MAIPSPVLPILLLFFIFFPQSPVSAMNCKEGFFLKRSVCTKCPPGTYRTRRSASTCIPCPKGTYNPYFGAQGLDVCIECPANTFSTTDGATSKSDCLPCPLGLFSPSGSSSCLTCPPGSEAYFATYDSPGSSLGFTHFRGLRFACFQGQSEFTCSIDGPIEYKCYKCPWNTFTDKPNGNISCEPCPEGTASLPGASKCVPKSQVRCPPGKERKSDGSCSLCSSSSFSDGTMDFCEMCPPGLIGSEKRDSCVPCPVGTFRPTMYDTKCERCKSGENSFVTGASFCAPDNTSCAPNFFRNENGSCQKCSVFQRYDADNKKCVACPSDHVSKGGFSNTCKRCPVGMMAEKRLGRCSCKPGWGYVEGTTASPVKCNKCAPGTVRRNSFDRPFCRECDRHRYAPRSGMTRCLFCPDGMVQPLSGQKECVRPRCKKGLVVSKFYESCVEPASNCPPGYRRQDFRPGFEPECYPRSCPAGSALILLGSSGFIEGTTDCKYCRCGGCQNDERYAADTSRCLKCPKHQFSDGGLSKRCKRCPDGKIFVEGQCRCVDRRHMVNGKCVRCPAGTFGYENSAGCMPCPPGTRAAGVSIDKCNNCKRGTFSSRPGSTSCEQCPSGTTTFGIGEAGCVAVGSID